MHLGGETLTTIWGLPITNTVLSVFLIDSILIALAIILRKRLSYIPGKLQAIAESIIDFIKGLLDSHVAEKYGKVVIPWLATFFIFIILNNWIGLLPGMETIYLKKHEEPNHVEALGNSDLTEEHQKVSDNLDNEAKLGAEAKGDHANVEILSEGENSTNQHQVETNGAEHGAGVEHEHEELPLFKGANSDLNVTAALAVVSFLFIHLVTIYLKGAKGWFSHYFHIKGLGIGMAIFFVIIGLLEIVLDPLKYVSLALRLFGNILAGEVLVANMTIVPLVAVPFMLLEVLVGFLQALIFTGLTAAFLSSMLAGGEHH